MRQKMDYYTADSFKEAPYTINDVVDILRAEGFPTEIMEAPEEHTVCFRLDDVPIYIHTEQIPSIIFELTFPLSPEGLPLEKRIEAAHNATRDSFLAKVFVDPEAFNGYDLVSAQTECIADTKEHITNNLDRYINILKAAMSRYVDGIRKMKEPI